jgi:hypothetical protein
MKAWSYCFSQESCTLASLLRLTATWYKVKRGVIKADLV